MSTFYASADGTVFHPVSDEARRCAHDSSKARERLALKLARRRAKEREEKEEGMGDQDGVETKQGHGEGASICGLVGSICLFYLCRHSFGCEMFRSVGSFFALTSGIVLVVS